MPEAAALKPYAAVGAYPADRAAALSGVPKSTIHYWAREGILVPSVSAERVKLWSYADLLGLRTIYWLRKPKTLADGQEISSTTMSKIVRALAELQRLDFTTWVQKAERIRVDPAGHVYIKQSDQVVVDGAGTGQIVVDFDLVAPLESFIKGAIGPDLRRPRENLRITPGKLSGSPHIEATRLETIALAALGRRGFSVEKIHSLYPFAHHTAIREALELEAQLERNVRLLAA